MHVLMKAIPQLTIQLNGVIQPVTMPTKEHLMICIKRNPMIVGETKSSSKPTNIVQECDAVQGATELEKDNNVKSGQMWVKNGDGVLGLNEAILELEKLNTAVPMSVPEPEEEVESGELLDEVDVLCDRDDEESDSEDAPDWMFEEGEMCSSDCDHVFCPAPH